MQKNFLDRRDLLNRAAVAIIFIYFGFLKIIQVSPAEELVTKLQSVTLPFLSSSAFVIFLGLVEMLVGSLFLVRRITVGASIIFALHMATTFLPFIFLPDVTWFMPGVPTLTGQYILKNIALIALVYTIFTDYHLRFVEEHDPLNPVV
jgi:uncharacterized membrane protein YkgB